MFDSRLVLKHVPIFSDLDDSLLSKIEEVGIVRDYKKDITILNQQYEGTGLYIIINGKVKVTENDSQGGEIILDILGELDYFGEMSLIDNKNPSANVVAMENTELFFLAREEFIRLLNENPIIGIALLEEITRRLRMSDSKIKSLSIANAEGRIASAILHIAENSGTIQQGSVQVTLPYQHVYCKFSRNFQGNSFESSSFTREKRNYRV